MADTGSGSDIMNIPPSPGLERQSARAPVEKKISAKSSNGPQTGSVRMKLKKMDEYEAKDAHMSAVFGVAPREVKNTLKVNPLYDQYGQGVIEVSETDAQTAKAPNMRGSRGSSGDKSNRFSRSDPDEGETKIAYGSNFMLGRGKEAENGSVKNATENRNKQLTTQGRVMPSRITRSSKQGNQGNPPRSSYKDPESPPPERSKVRRWRLIMLLILIVLILALALVLAIYFLTRDNAR